MTTLFSVNQAMIEGKLQKQFVVNSNTVLFVYTVGVWTVYVQIAVDGLVKPFVVGGYQQDNL